MNTHLIPTLSLLSFSLISFAQEPTIAPPLTVSEKPLVSVQQTGQDVSIATSLQTLPGVVVLTQGQAVGQSDLSIRGSNFSGAGLSMFGLSLGNAQTEHFNAELPFPAWWFAQPAVLTGVQQAAQTEGHLTGTVDLSPLPIEDRNTLTLGIDNKNGYWLNGGVNKRCKKPTDPKWASVHSPATAKFPEWIFPITMYRSPVGAPGYKNFRMRAVAI